MKKQLLISIIFTLGITLSYANTVDSNNVDKEDKEEEEDQRWAIIPVIMRNEASGFGLGAAGMHFFLNNDTLSHKSHIRFIGIATTKKQAVAAIAPDFWFKNNMYHLTGDLSYNYWPIDYYGIGNNTGEAFEKVLMNKVNTMIGIEKGWQQKYYIGGELHFAYADVNYADSGLLVTDHPIGYNGGRVSGISLNATFDDRNHIQFPTSGFYSKYKTRFYTTTLGSDYTFIKQEVEVSTYIPTGGKSTIALSLQGVNLTGDAPFHLLASPNGETILRGIKGGKYSDNNMIAALSEFRFPIWNIINAGVFAEMAQVAPEISEFKIDKFKYGVGAGIHIAVVPKEMVQLRFDFSYVDNGLGFIIAIMEAF